MLPGGVPSVFRSQPDRKIIRGLGGRCWDQKGFDYIDFICGYGPISLGHANNEVTNAVRKQLDIGIIFPSSSPVQEQLQAEIMRLFPHTNDCLFLKTGSEAIAAAVRLARAATGKTKIIRCGFHGWHDLFVSPYLSWHLYESDPRPARPIPGVPHESSEALTFHWDGEDIGKLAEYIKGHSNEIAAFILDPIQLREPLGENLRQIREITSDAGVLFIMDEIKTGFRVHLLGVQGLYDVEADITVFSKAIANGFPLSVVIAKKELTKWMPDIRIMGTYNNELISMAAALATLAILERPGSIDWLWQTGQTFIDGVNAVLERHHLIDDIRAVPYRWPCMPALWFRQNSTPARTMLPSLQSSWTQQGLLLLPNHPNFTCLAHTEQDIRDGVQRFEAAIQQCAMEQG